MQHRMANSWLGTLIFQCSAMYWQDGLLVGHGGRRRTDGPAWLCLGPLALQVWGRSPPPLIPAESVSRSADRPAVY